jgi:flagellar biosynthetic protein FliQ
MNADSYLSFVQRSLEVALMVSLPPVLAAMAAGLASGVFQTVTQIQDSSLSSVSRLLAAMATIALAGRWAGSQLQQLLVDVLTALAEVGS